MPKTMSKTMPKLDYELSEEKQLQVVKDLLTYKTHWEDNSKDFIDNLDEYWDRHLGEYSCKKNKDYPWKGSADIQTGVIQYSDSALEARFNATLNSKQFVHITAPTAAGRVAAKACEEYLNYGWKPKARPEDICIDWFQNIVVEGLGILHIKPQKESEYKRKRYIIKELVSKIGGVINKLIGYVTGEDGTMQWGEVKNGDYLGCVWEAVDNSQIGFDTSVDRLRKCKFFYKELWLNKSDCKKRERDEDKPWQNVDKVFLPEDKNDKDKGVKTDNVIIDNPKQETQAGYTGSENTKLGKQKFIEMFIDYDVNDDDIDERCYFIFNPEKSVLNYWSYNKFSDERLPYIESQFYRIAGRIPGQGNPQRLASLNDELDMLQNQRVDNASKHNSIGGTFVPSKELDEKTMNNFIVPGKWLPLTRHDQINRWVDQGTPLDLQSQQEFVISLLERKSLVSDYSLGRESEVNKNPTLGGTQMLLQQASMQTDPLVRNVQIAGIEAIRQTLLCFYETMPSEGIKYSREIPVDTTADPDAPKKEETVTFRREHLEFIDEFQISFLAGAADIMADTDKQIATMVLQAFGADETGEIDTFAVKKNWLEKVDPVLAKEIIRTPQEVQMVQMIKQKAAELLQKEQILNQKMAEVEKMKQDEIIKQGQQSEAEFEKQLRSMNLPEDKIQSMLDEYRNKYIQTKLVNQEENQVENQGETNEG